MIVLKPHTAGAPTTTQTVGFGPMLWTFCTATLGTLIVLDPPDVYRFQKPASDVCQFQKPSADVCRFQAEDGDEYRL